MRVLVLPTVWTVLFDIFVWLCLHVAVSLWATRRPAAKFSVENPLYRPKKWERESPIYRLLGVHGWKSRLPDAAPWFSGVPKSHIPGRGRAALSLFLIETCRGELAHWLVFLCGPLFFLWNKPWVGAIMLAYGFFANIPCIIAQRYNRARLWRILDKG